MKKRTLKKMTMGLGLVAGVSLMSACTKTVPYDPVYKEKVHAKSEIDTGAEYLYVASSDASSRDDMGTSDATPYMQGQEKIVKFRFTEDTLRIVEIEEDARLKSNELNEKILLEIPIQHVEYRCAEDRYGKCTNKEEENNEKNWANKANFIPDLSKVKSPGLSLLPVESGKLWGDSCYRETSSRFLDYKLEKGALNIQVEKTFTASIDCLSSLNGLQSLSDLQSRIVYHYSFTKLNGITSKDYKTVSYPRKDEGTFGFFSTEYRKYDVDFTRTEKMRQDFMNRWNPDRKEVVYYMTENFNKPEFAAIKKASETAFARVNQGLKDAGIDLRLTLKDGSGKASGDARNSMLIMVEDPVAGGPLGYGPSVANPRTGEIVSARVVMYYGNMLQGLSMTYDELVKEMKREKKNGDLFKASAAADGKKASASMNGRVLSDELKNEMSMRNSITSRLAAKLARDASQSYGKIRHESLQKGSKNLSSATTRWTTDNFARMSEKQFMKLTMQSAAKSEPEDRIAAMSSGHCMYPSELFPFDEAIAKGLDSKLSGDLKPWEDLSDAEKNEVIALVGPEIWIPTLIHEIGHNLGLRHNFGGSEDKDNFYSAAELAKMNVKHKVPYSSVMDYGQRELNLLPTLGKYDIAALKFGYLRQVEKADGKFVEVKTTIKDLEKADANLKLKDYQYCSDEHVEVNPNCKRFDEGTTRTEIVTSLIEQYEKFYNLRNLRRGRENFTQMTDRGYMGRIRSTFGYIRAFMENYEMIKARFKVADNDEAWTQVEWLKDVKNAALISGRFFVKVLKTPDLHCAIARRSEP
ncbi:MAG: zinc-dependent metalloprotease, partial [Bdellovibrionaceae bacterium]|nr:zinc-dependent metalloprotease [Pseudobdellovibrionaceae bacterium]